LFNEENRYIREWEDDESWYNEWENEKKFEEHEWKKKKRKRLN
jgi:hypothetical protein